MRILSNVQHQHHLGALARDAEKAGSTVAVEHQPDAVDVKVAEEAGEAAELGVPQFVDAGEDPLLNA